MLGTGLYFPHIDIHDPAWLRSAILFWDNIQTIAPSAIEEPYQNTDSKICHAEGYLTPLRCDLQQDIIEDLGRKILRLGDGTDGKWRDLDRTVNETFRSVGLAHDITWELEEAFLEAGLHPQKLSPEIRLFLFQHGLSRMHHGKIPPGVRQMISRIEMAQMHPEKLPYILRDLFERGAPIDHRSEDWLLVDSRFANAYMSALAAQLSQKLAMSPLTSDVQAQGLSFRFLFDEVVDSSPTRAEGVMMGVIMRGLKVDSSVPVERLLKFREARRDQYADFAGKIVELSDSLHSNGDLSGEALFKSAQRTYERNIEPSLRALKRELDQQSISAVWEGAYRAITISVPSAGALAYFTGLAGPALLGAGAALAVADIGVRGYLAGQRSRANNPFSYLHDVNSSFGLPDFGNP